MDSRSPKSDQRFNEWNLIYIAFVANLGSFLFGYDFGAVSTLITAIETYSGSDDDAYSIGYYSVIDSSDSMLGLVAALAGISTIVTYVFLLIFANKVSKRDEMIAAAACYFLGALIESLSGLANWDSSSGVAVLFFGRVIYGAGIAMSFHSVPIYASEATPSAYRCMVGSATESMISFGVLLGYVIGYFNSTQLGWVVVFRVGSFIALLMLVLAIFLPQSPKYLIRNQSSREEVIDSIRFIYPDSTEDDYDELVSSIQEQDRNIKRSINSWQRSLEYKDNVIYKALPTELLLLISDPTLRRCLLLAIMFVTLQMFSGASAILYFISTIMSDIYPSTYYLCILGFGLVKLLFACIMILIGEMAGRREFLLVGTVFFVLGLLGFCVGLGVDSSPLALTGLYVSVAGYELGLGTLLWTLLNELFPHFVRSAANSIAVSTLMIWSAVMTFALPFIEDALGLMYLFVVFGCVALIATILIYIFVPETQGVDLEQSYKLVRITCNATTRCCGIYVEDIDDEDLGADDRDPSEYSAVI